MSRPFNPRFSNRGAPRLRVNGRIRAREVRVIGIDGQQVGVKSLGDAIQLARASGVDLVEVAPNATPPVCRVVDYGRYVYEENKRKKDSKKHQHANKVKEVQLSASIDGHDFGIKVAHAIDFLCEEMKVKASLRFRGREMAHKEFGFQVVQRFVQELGPYGQPDFEPKLVGRSVNVMFSPLPRNKRAKNPRQAELDAAAREAEEMEPPPTSDRLATEEANSDGEPAGSESEEPPSSPDFNNNPFKKL